MVQLEMVCKRELQAFTLWTKGFLINEKKPRSDVTDNGC